MKTMSSISANKLFVLSSGLILYLYLQINNSNKIKLWKDLMLCKKMGLSKNKRLLNRKNSICVQHSKPGEFQITISTWIEQFPSFISLQLLACELAICVVAIFFSINKVLHSVWRDVCSFHFVLSKFEINYPYQLRVCKNSKMWMLHCALNRLQTLCIQI
jgi:hypothetical protein